MSIALEKARVDGALLGSILFFIFGLARAWFYPARPASIDVPSGVADRFGRQPGTRPSLLHRIAPFIQAAQRLRDRVPPATRLPFPLLCGCFGDGDGPASCGRPAFWNPGCPVRGEARVASGFSPWLSRRDPFLGATHLSVPPISSPPRRTGESRRFCAKKLVSKHLDQKSEFQGRNYQP